MIKKMKDYKIGIMDDIYHIAITFYIGIDGKKDYEQISDNTVDNSIGQTYYNPPYTAIYINNRDNIPVLVHELIHAVKFNMKERGLIGEETLCYLVEYFVKEYSKFLTSKNK